MDDPVTRRRFVASLGLAAAAAAAGAEPGRKDRREALLSFKDGGRGPDFVPAAFFIHFDEKHRLGKPAVEKHLLRMGPRNTRRIQAKARALLEALQLPAR